MDIRAVRDTDGQLHCWKCRSINLTQAGIAKGTGVKIGADGVPEDAALKLKCESCGLFSVGHRTATEDDKALNNAPAEPPPERGWWAKQSTGNKVIAGVLVFMALLVLVAIGNALGPNYAATTTTTSTSVETAEASYLALMRADFPGTPDATSLSTGRSVCSNLDLSNGNFSLLANHLNTDKKVTLTAKQIGTVIGASVRWLCPRWSAAMDAWAASVSSK